MHFFKPSRFTIRTLIALLAIGVGHTIAQPASITLPEALLRAEQGNPDLAAQGLSARAIEALKEQAGLRPNPVLGLELENFVGTGPNQGFDGAVATVQASQTFERGDKRAQRIVLADARSEVARQAWTLQLMQLRRDTALAYVEALVTAHHVKLAQRELDATTDAEDTIDDAVSAGRESAAASARARAASAKARVALNQAKSHHAKAQRSLARLWGDTDTEFSVANELPPAAALPNRSSILAKIDVHTRLELQQSEISRRRADLDLQHATAKSDIKVVGGVRFMNDGSDAAFVAGVSWPLAVRNPNQGNIKSAREGLAAAEQSVAGIRNDLYHAFDIAWQDLETAHSAAQTLRQDAIPAIDEVITLTRQAHERGQVSLLDVIRATQERVDLEHDILDADADYARALVKLDTLTDPSLPLMLNLLTSP